MPPWYVPRQHGVTCGRPSGGAVKVVPGKGGRRCAGRLTGRAGRGWPAVWSLRGRGGRDAGANRGTKAAWGRRCMGGGGLCGACGVEGAGVRGPRGAVVWGAGAVAGCGEAPARRGVGRGRTGACRTGRTADGPGADRRTARRLPGALRGPWPTLTLTAPTGALLSAPARAGSAIARRMPGGRPPQPTGPTHKHTHPNGETGRCRQAARLLLRRRAARHPRSPGTAPIGTGRGPRAARPAARPAIHRSHAPERRRGPLTANSAARPTARVHPPPHGQPALPRRAGASPQAPSPHPLIPPPASAEGPRPGRPRAAGRPG